MPCALRGDPGQVWGMRGMKEGGQSRLLSPRERPCSGPRGVQEVSRWLYEWMDGWLTGLSGWMLVCWGRRATRPTCPTEKAWKATGPGLGNAKHDTRTKPTTVPRSEALSWATGHEESACHVWMEGEMDEKMTGKQSDS